LCCSCGWRELQTTLNLALNIISFDVPFPANYGGVIDVFYKIKHLHEKGVKIHFHCFEYGREHSAELENFCEKVYYYPRKTGILNNFSSLPYTVKSRISDELEKNLTANEFPILFEVLHTCYLLDSPKLKNRLKIFRHSNIEHDYYLQLAASEKNLLKKFYLKMEADKLKKFETVLHHANLILAVSQTDLAYFRTNYPKVRSEYLPSFHPNKEMTVTSGKGNYILYHGKLSVSENYEAVEWLIKNVFSKIKFPVKIAGLDPPAFLKSLCSKYRHIELLASPSTNEMNELIQDAQVHVLYTAQATGLKLKLLNVIHAGRFVVCNSKMLEGTDIRSSQSLAVSNTPEDFIKDIEACWSKSFSNELLEERKHQLTTFSNEMNVDKLIGFLKKK
jgi:hypothetical protein